jgi:hypothetical protein
MFAAKSVQVGVVVGSLVAILGCVVKESAVHGWELFPLAAQKQGGPFHHKRDYSMMGERPGYWVRSEDEIPAALARGQS